MLPLLALFLLNITTNKATRISPRKSYAERPGTETLLPTWEEGGTEDLI